MDSIRILRSLGRHWQVTGPVLALTIVLVFMTPATPTEYQAVGDVVLVPEAQTGAHGPAPEVTTAAALDQFTQAPSAAIAEQHDATLSTRSLTPDTIEVTAVADEPLASQQAVIAAMQTLSSGLTDAHLATRIHPARPTLRELAPQRHLAAQFMTVSSAARSTGRQPDVVTANVLTDLLESKAGQAHLDRQAGHPVDLQVAVTIPSIVPMLTLATRAGDPDTATADFDVAVDALRDMLAHPPDVATSMLAQVEVEVLSAPTTARDVSPLFDARRLALLAGGLLLAVVVALLVERRDTHGRAREALTAGSARPAAMWQQQPPDRSAAGPSRATPHPLPGTPAWSLSPVMALTVWMVLLYGISPNQVFGPLGAIGTPAMILAAFCGMTYLVWRLLPLTDVDRGPNPMRVAIFAYAWFALLSFAVALSRPLSAIEQFGALRASTLVLILGGLALVVADGLGSTAQVTKLLQRLTWVGAAFAALGIIQFFTGRTLTISIPGLTWNHAAAEVGMRSLFNRPTATAAHPIEFSVLTAALFPLALHFMLHEPPGRRRRLAGLACVLLGLAVPMSVSRSGIVAVMVGLVVLAAGWTWQQRLRAIGIAGILVPLLWLTIPGLVGTIRSMFTGRETDDSIQGRLERIPRIIEYIRERPWLGRGEGTFNMEEYFVVDNGLYLKLIETGVVGTAAFALLLLTGIYLAVAVARDPDPTVAHMARAISASLAALAVSYMTFDAAGYKILSGTLFLLLGAAGALWRLRRRDASLVHHPPAPSAHGSGHPGDRPTASHRSTTRALTRGEEGV